MITIQEGSREVRIQEDKIVSLEICECGMKETPWVLTINTINAFRYSVQFKTREELDNMAGIIEKKLSRGRFII